MSHRWSRAFWLTLVLTLVLTGVAVAQEAVHWSYEGETGPEHWGELSADYALCATGKEQTPVDITANAPVNNTNITFDYKAAPLTILNNGHTVQVAYAEGSSINLEGTPYALRQFHFHTPSEHKVSGAAYDMEMHLVHQNASGGLAVVGVLIKEGAENAAFAPMIESLPPGEAEAETISGVMVDANTLMPADREYYRYNGSLTTPPCSEGVRWVVLDTPIEMSSEQLAAFQGIMHENARPIQPLNARQFQGTQATPGTLPPSGAETDYSRAMMLMSLGALYLLLGVLFALMRRQKA